MTLKRNDQTCALLKGIDTSDPGLVAAVDPGEYIQHNPHRGGGPPVLGTTLRKQDSYGGMIICYDRGRRLLAEGNFVRCGSDGC